MDNMDDNENVVWKSNSDLVQESQSSIELKQTSKGINFAVKIYDKDPHNAFKIATELFDACQRKYLGGC
jgi:hypothetical protein